MADAQQQQQQREFQSRLASGAQTAAQYEDRGLQAQARAAMPLLQLRAAAVAASLSDHSLSFHDAFLEALLRWFKRDFFSWVNALPCERCGGETTASGMTTPTPAELAEGGHRVEAYTCAACNTVSRFPRLNAAGALLRTRRGRCGEWANAFTLCCRAAGLRARYVLDWSDHVWTEVWQPHEKRWVHADSCEAARDQPRLYERGWGKKLAYVVAFDARGGAVDVTRRYVLSWRDALGRRTLVPERWLAAALLASRQQARARLTPAAAALAAQRDADDEASIEALIASEAAAAGEDLPGRQSGAEEWRRARGELGAPGPVTADALAAALAVALAAMRSQPRQ